MSKGSLISVVMSVYSEPEEWLKESINSILNQTFTSFEFIIINDNPDREINRALLKEYEKLDDRIVVVNNKENIGLTKSLNIGLSLAKGKYIARMDADDICIKTRLEKQYKFMNYNQDYIACGTRARIINEKGIKVGTIRVPFADKNIRREFIIRNVLIHPSLMMRTSLLRKYKLSYNEEFKCAQDYELISRMLQVGKIVNLKENLILYRHSQQQISNAKLDLQNYFALQVRKRLFDNQIKVIRDSNGCPFSLGYDMKYLSRLFDEHNLIKRNMLLENTCISLVLNSTDKIRIVIILKMILFKKCSLLDKVRLLSRIIN